MAAWHFRRYPARLALDSTNVPTCRDFATNLPTIPMAIRSDEKSDLCRRGLAGGDVAPTHTTPDDKDTSAVERR